MKMILWSCGVLMLALSQNDCSGVVLRLDGGGRRRTSSITGSPSNIRGRGRKLAENPFAPGIEQGSDSDEINTKWLSASISHLFSKELPKIHRQTGEGSRAPSNLSSAASIGGDPNRTSAELLDMTPERAALRRAAARLARLDSSLSSDSRAPDGRGDSDDSSSSAPHAAPPLAPAQPRP